MSNETTSSAAVENLVRNNPQLNHPATVAGIEALITKLAPLLQGERLHNLVDLASALSDVVDMADNAMVQKLARDYENLATAAFNLNGAFRYASAQGAAESEPPTLWQTLRRFNRDADARRGLAVVVALLTLLGRDARHAQQMVGHD
mgnify:CR=1 FL=1